VDLVVQLPEDFSFSPYEILRAVALVSTEHAKQLQKVMADSRNWVGLLGRFGYERALSDYIALHPDRLEDGLQAQPNTKLQEKALRVREKVLGDRSRLDVLLRDRKQKPVIVECKQESPTVENVIQLRRYLRGLKKEIHQRPRGILVHGGARRIERKVWRKGGERPYPVEFMRYELDVDFAPSC